MFFLAFFLASLLFCICKVAAIASSNSIFSSFTFLCIIYINSLLNYRNDLSNFTKKIEMKDIFNDTEYEYELIVYNESMRNFETKSS